MVSEDLAKITAEKCPKFSSFAKDKLPMPGEKKHLAEILNKEIIVTDYRITTSKKRDGTKCLQIQFLMDGVPYVVFTGSNVLIDQIQTSEQQIPFRGTIVKVNKYYSFS